MFYSIRHLTQYRYSAPVFEHVSEVRMHPRTEDSQRCMSFELTVEPKARVFSYQDYLENTIHHFNIAEPHTYQVLTTEAVVEVRPPETPTPLPESCDLETWETLDQTTASGAFWEWLHPSRFVQFTDALHTLAQELEATRQTDPLTLLRTVNHSICDMFAYVPQSTHVDSSIDEAIASREGVCQDFTHIMLALLRRLGIPARYVSGYLFHRSEDHSAEDATHAWLEAWLPEFGWIGLDPTNNLITAERHIRVAIGRDYLDVPPSQGVFKGEAEEELWVGVRVVKTNAPEESSPLVPPDGWAIDTVSDEAAYAAQAQQQ